MSARIVSQSFSDEWAKAGVMIRVALDSFASRNLEQAETLVDLDDPALLEQLASRHATLLTEHGMAQLNVSEIRSKNRPVTQTISRDLYVRGVSGILFRSNEDDGRCVAAFFDDCLVYSSGTLEEHLRDV